MLFQILGNLQIEGVALRSPQERRLLAALLLHRNGTLSIGAAEDVVWPDRPPASRKLSLQSKISRLRSLLGSDRVRYTGTGYSLRVESGECDADEFERRAVEVLDSPSGDPLFQLQAADDALSLYRGPLLDEFTDETFVGGAAVRVEQRRLALEEARLGFMAQLGLHTRMLHAVTPLETEHPYNERLCEFRMLALAGSGRVVDALRAFHAFRSRLVEDVGVEPSGSLSMFEARLLTSGMDRPGPTGLVERSTVETDVSSRREASNGTEAGWAHWNDPLTTRPPFVGREETIARLSRALRRASGPTAVVIEGDGGIGKTRVVMELLAVTSRRSIPGKVLRCRPSEALFGPFRQALPAHGTTDWSEPTARAQMVGALARSLHDQLRHGVLVVEDLHWADQGTLEVLSSFAIGLDSHDPVTMVLTTRPFPVGDERAAWLALFRRSLPSTAIDLHGFSEPEVFELIHRAAGRQPSPALSDVLHQRTLGNPLLALTGLENLRGSGALRTDGLTLTSHVREFRSVPADLQGLLEVAYQRLSPLAQQLLMDVALATEEPSIEELPALAGLGEDTRLRILTEVEQAGLIDAPHEVVVYRHDLYRQVIADRIPFAELPARHLAMLEAISPDAARNGAQLPAGPAVLALAQHADGAGVLLDPTRRFEIFRAAGYQALTITDWTLAARWMRRALSLADDLAVEPEAAVAVQVAAGAALYRAHDPAAAEVLAAAVERAREVGDLERWGTALLDYCRTLSGQSAKSVSLPRGGIEQYVAKSQELHPALCARLLGMSAEHHASVGDRITAAEHLEQAERLAEQAPSDLLQAEMQFAAGLRALTELELDRASDCFERSVARSRAAQSNWVMSWGLGRGVFTSLLQGDIVGAGRLARQARATQLAAGTWGELSFTAAIEAHLHDITAEPELCDARLAEAERLLIRSGFSFTAQFLYPLHIARAAHRGDLAVFDDAMARWEQLPARVPSVFCALREVIAGDPDRARSIVWRTVTAQRAGPAHLAPLVAQITIASLLDDKELAVESLDTIEVLAAKGVAHLPTMQEPLRDQIDALRSVAGEGSSRTGRN